MGPRRDLVRQPRVRLRSQPAPAASGAGEVPVPGDEHRRRRDRTASALGDALCRLHGRGSPGRRHRRRAREHAGARLRGCDRRTEVPRRGTADQGGVRAAARARRQGPDRGHPRGDRRRPEHDRQRGRSAVAGADHGHRRRAPGHDRGRDDRRPHPPHLEPDAGQHPDHRGHQRRDELLRAPAAGQGRRRRLGRRCDAGGEDPRCRPAGGRQGDRRRRQRQDGRAPEPGDRQAVDRHPASPDPAEGVGDGEHGRRRDAPEVSGRRRGVHQLRRAPSGPAGLPAECRRTARRDHVGRGVRGPAVRQPDDDPHAHRSAAEDRVRERVLARLQRRDQHGALPAGLGPEGDVPLQRHDRRSSTASGRRRTARAGRRSRSGTRTPFGS